MPTPFHTAADFASKCGGKIRYTKHAHAERVVDIMRRSGKGNEENFYAYKCRYCGGYHTGHLPANLIAKREQDRQRAERRKTQEERDREAFAWLGDVSLPGDSVSASVSQNHVVELTKSEREQEAREERDREQRERKKQRRRSNSG